MCEDFNRLFFVYPFFKAIWNTALHVSIVIKFLQISPKKKNTLDSPNGAESKWISAFFGYSHKLRPSQVKTKYFQSPNPSQNNNIQLSKDDLLEYQDKRLMKVKYHCNQNSSMEREEAACKQTQKLKKPVSKNSPFWQ